MDRKFIIAYNRTEFKQWYHPRAEEFIKKEINIVYVTCPKVLRGHRDISGYLIGQWYKRDDIAEIIELIRLSNVSNRYLNLYYDYEMQYAYKINHITGQRIEYM